MHPRYIAVLDTMWGRKSEVAPRWFEINPWNKSGDRLYDIVDGWEWFFSQPFVDGGYYNCLKVTNACKEMVYRADDHGKPDPEWLHENLRRLSLMRAQGKAVLLVCGKVAQKTYLTSGFQWKRLVVFMPHPAARSWSDKREERCRKEIAAAIKKGVKFYTFKF